MGRGGGVATQRPAKPWTPVRIRAAPPPLNLRLDFIIFYSLGQVILLGALLSASLKWVAYQWKIL